MLVKLAVESDRGRIPSLTLRFALLTELWLPNV